MEKQLSERDASIALRVWFIVGPLVGAALSGQVDAFYDQLWQIDGFEPASTAAILFGLKFIIAALLGLGITSVVIGVVCLVTGRFKSIEPERRQ